MRDIFQTTFTSAATGTLVPLAGIEVTVYPVGNTTTPSVIYQKRDGQAQGNAIEAVTTGGPNPFTTGPSGAVEFWVPSGVYDIHIRDTASPERISRRGAGSSNPPLQFNSMPADAGSVPTTVLAGDGGITLPSIAPDVNRQSVPVGAVLDWWRPDSTVSLPLGYEICDGKQVAKAGHDFSVAGAVTLPDLRNKFILGADPYKTDGSGAVVGDGSAASGAQHPNAPGIRGTGGSMRVTLLDNQIPSHNHGGYTGGGSTGGGTTGWMDRNVSHTHGTGGAGDQMVIPVGNNPAANLYLGGGYGIRTQGISGTDVNHLHSVPSLSVPQLTIPTHSGGLPHDNQPSFYGLLKIMKVKKA